MNVIDCARHLLTHFAPEERDIPDDLDFPDRNAAALTAINGALQELYGKGGKWVRQDERGAILHAPTSVTITVTAGSREATIDSGDWQTWMAGCSIAITGSAIDNQIRNDTNAVTLKYPHDGDSGTTTAIVWCDCVTLDTDVLEVIEPVRVDRRQISPMPSPYSKQVGHPLGDFNFYRQAIDNPFPVDRVAASQSSPQAFTIDTWAPAPNSQNSIRIRLWPAPDLQYFLDYRVMMKPPKIASLLNLDGVTTALLSVGAHGAAVIYEAIIPGVTGNAITVSQTIAEVEGVSVVVMGTNIQVTFPSGTRPGPIADAVNADVNASNLVICTAGTGLLHDAVEISTTNLFGGTGTYGILTTEELPVPFDAVETIFLPLAIKRLAQCPFWRGLVGEQSVNDGYKIAGDLLKSANPSPNTGIRFVTKF